MNPVDRAERAHRDAVCATLAVLAADDDLLFDCHFDSRSSGGRHPEEQRALIKEVGSLDHQLRSHAHSRSGLLARLLQRMADGIDPTGEARKRT